MRIVNAIYKGSDQPFFPKTKETLVFKEVKPHVFIPQKPFCPNGEEIEEENLNIVSKATEEEFKEIIGINALLQWRFFESYELLYPTKDSINVAVINMCTNAGFPEIETFGQLSKVLDYLPKPELAEIKDKAKELENTNIKLYNIAETQSRKIFKEMLEGEFNLSQHPKKDMLFSKAWERGHSNGLHDVYCIYSDLAELLC
jgi:hypothetical protein